MADENVTLQDVFRVVNEMRGDFNERLDKIEAAMDGGFKAASAERQAIRDVVDNELAGQGQVMALEGHLQQVQRTPR